MTDGPRVLTIDIETLPIEGYVWELFDQNVALEQIKTEWSIASYCAKWLGRPKLYYDYTGGHGRSQVRKDKRLMKGLWSLLDAADIVVAQNGKRFDIKKINARLIIHGFKPYSPIKVVDTLQVAKTVFGFTSNKLAWQSQYLTDTPKSEHKRFPGFALWKACLEDDKAAWSEMKKYNCIDVIATEKVYLRQLPWIANHPNFGTFATHIGAVCPNCGSGKLHKRGLAITEQGKYARLQCMKCGRWSRTKEQLIPQDRRKRLLVGAK